MKQRLAAWMRALTLDDPLQQQHAFTLQAILLGLMAVGLFGSLLPFTAPIPFANALAVAAMTLSISAISLISLALLRRKRFIGAVRGMMLGLTLVLVVVLIGTGLRQNGATLMAFSVPIVLSGLLGGRSMMGWAIALGLAGVVLVMLLEAMEASIIGFAAPNGANVGGILGGFFVTAISLGIIIDRFGTALHLALRSSRRRERELEELRGNLEHAVEERTATLQKAIDEIEKRAAVQEELLQANQAQAATIRELSVPILPISADTLVLPLVGVLDAERLQMVQERALKALESRRVREILLDVTGVPLIDDQNASDLLAVVQATRLMGARTALVGISPEVAQSLVTHGLDLKGLRTYASLETAIRSRR